jgi:hypothetical protein
VKHQCLPQHSCLAYSPLDRESCRDCIPIGASYCCKSSHCKTHQKIAVVSYRKLPAHWLLCLPHIVSWISRWRKIISVHSMQLYTQVLYIPRQYHTKGTPANHNAGSASLPRAAHFRPSAWMLMHSCLHIVLLDRCIQWGSVSVHHCPINIFWYCTTCHGISVPQYTSECTMLPAICMDTCILSIQDTVKFTWYPILDSLIGALSCAPHNFYYSLLLPQLHSCRSIWS